MAIDGFLNFETGDLAECYASAGAVSASATGAHSGAYCLRANPVGSGVASVTLGQYAITFPAAKTCELVKATFSAGTTVKFRFWIYVAALPSAKERVFTTLASGTPVWAISIDSSSNLSLEYGGVFQYQFAGVTTGAWHLVELSILSTSSSGSAPWNFTLDGVSQGSSSAQTAIGAIDQVAFGKYYDSSGSGYDVLFDDIAWSTGTAPASVGSQGCVLVPAGAGSNSQWTGSYADVDEVPSDGATTAIVATNPNRVQDFTLTDPATVGITPGSTINAVKLVIFAESGATNTVYFDYLISGTAYGRGNPTLPIGSYPPFGIFAATNPATGVAWTTSDLASLQVRCRTSDFGDTQISTVYVLVDFIPAAPIVTPLPRVLSVPRGPARRLPTPAFLARSCNPPNVRHDPLSRTAITVVPIPPFHYLNRD
ncbi:hypothetical protein [Singulisphaera sp. PoT]|uniref:hypothetical protein n=1 Tax=Singulisphaera sp. PoT TaxID=3411797 RepID=UPI003BF57006